MTEIPLADLAERYFFCDPASGKTDIKRVRARSAIIGVAVDNLGRFFVISAWADRCSTDKLIDRIIETCEKFKPKTFGIEDNAMQSLFADSVRYKARLDGKEALPIVGVTQPTRIDKDFRVRAVLQPVVADGRLFIQQKHHELKAELTAFPMSQLKDLVDALASAISLAPPRRMQRERDAEDQSLEKYLRETNAPLWYIRDRLEQRRRGLVV